MIEVVVKIGGSLTRGVGLKRLCQRLAELGRQHRLLVVPGGGPSADTVRDYDKCYGLSDATAHWMAILAMDQYGYLLSDLIPHSQSVRDLKAAGEIALDGRVPVLLPFDLIRQADPLPHSWAVTSDSISAWVAKSAGAPKLVLLKDVDGLYRQTPSGEGEGDLLEAINSEQLANCEGVDRFLAAILGDSRLDLWIINGNEPRRLEELLAKGKTRGTRWRQ
jgi:aspartokinase-like uncharacterized kinase